MYLIGGTFLGAFIMMAMLISADPVGGTIGKAYKGELLKATAENIYNPLPILPSAKD